MHASMSAHDRRVASPADWGVYLVTDRGQTNGRPLLDVVAAALDGGIRAVQLRERDLPARRLFELATHMRALTTYAGAALLINERVDVALACAADGVQLPRHGMSIVDARQLLGADRLIGVSTHAPAEVADAAAGGADFAVFGPIFDTPSKRAYGPPLGLDALGAARAAAPRLPLFAIGGIDAARAAAVRGHGAAGSAVIRTVLGAADPAAAARALVRPPRDALRPEREDSGH